MNRVVEVLLARRDAIGLMPGQDTVSFLELVDVLGEAILSSSELERAFGAADLSSRLRACYLPVILAPDWEHALSLARGSPAPESGWWTVMIPAPDGHRGVTVPRTAVSTAALGILGVFITVWQWQLTKFRPRVASRIDDGREAIELTIANKGRASGIIDQVDVLLPDGRIDDGLVFEGFPDQTFRPLQLSALALMRIIIQAPPGHVFESGAQLLVGSGRTHPKILTPASMPQGAGLFGIKSALPPGSFS